MSATTRINTMHADNTIMQAATPEIALDAILVSTGQTLTVGEKQKHLMFKTREQLIALFAARAEL